MTTVLTSDLPAGSRLEMPCNNLLTVQFDTAPTTAVGGSAVSNVLFVDGTLGTAAGPGTIGAPFQTVQQAVTYAALTLLLAEVWIQCAPGSYVTPVNVPSGIEVGICAWGDKTGMPVQLSGDITLGDAASVIAFKNVACFMGTIRTSDLGLMDLAVSFQNCSCSAAILSNNISLYLRGSDCSGNVTATTATNLNTDGESWSWLIEYGVTILPAGFLRGFFDAGHDVATGTITANGLAIDATTFVAVAFPHVAVRANDRAEVQFADEHVQDFICGVFSVGVNEVVVWITNISRVSTNFAESALFTFHHQDMSSLDAP